MDLYVMCLYVYHVKTNKLEYQNITAYASDVQWQQNLLNNDGGQRICGMGSGRVSQQLRLETTEKSRAAGIFYNFLTVVHCKPTLSTRQ